MRFPGGIAATTRFESKHDGASEPASLSSYTQTWMLRKQENFSRSLFLTFTIYFVSEQGNRFGAKVISLGYLGYLNFYFLIFSVFSKLSVRELGE